MTNCIKKLVTYTCGNATGTTCTKVAATVFVPSSNTTCAAGEFAVLLQTEKTQYDGDRPLITALQTSTGTLTTTTNGLSSASTAAQTLNAAQQTDIATLKSQMQLIAAGSSLLGPQPPNPQIIQAEAAIFGLALTAGVLIWAVKRVYALFTPSYHLSES